VTVDEYAGAAEAWAGQVAAVYARLARAVVEDCPVPLAGARVLDVGAGTGVVSELAIAAGARVVAADLSHDMLRFERRRRPPAAVADVFALPFRERSFDAVLAACLVNHFEDPAAALRSAARTVRPGGAVVASSFGAAPDPLKETVDAVALRRGWTPPEWYLTIKRASATHLADPPTLAATGRDAGLDDVAARLHEVSMSSLSVDDAVAYRLSLPTFTAWLGSLAPAVRAGVFAEARDAAAPVVPSWSCALLVLTGRVSGRR
jgi:SAM-dependent methyltransferase